MQYEIILEQSVTTKLLSLPRLVCLCFRRNQEFHMFMSLPHKVFQQCAYGADMTSRLQNPHIGVKGTELVAPAAI